VLFKIIVFSMEIFGYNQTVHLGNIFYIVPSQSIFSLFQPTHKIYYGKRAILFVMAILWSAFTINRLVSSEILSHLYQTLIINIFYIPLSIFPFQFNSCVSIARYKNNKQINIRSLNEKVTYLMTEALMQSE